MHRVGGDAVDLALRRGQPPEDRGGVLPHRQRQVSPFEDVEDRAKVATLDEIKKEGWTLNISRYVLPPIGQDIPPLPEAVEAFKTALADARAAEDHLRKVLVEGGWLQ